MSQVIRPVSDAEIGSWTTYLGGTSNLWNTIDEHITVDGDYIQSEQLVGSEGFVGTSYVTKLDTAQDPGINTGFSVTIRIAKDSAGGNEVDAIIELRQDYTGEDDASLGTLIASTQIYNLSDTVSEETLTVSEAEAAQITDFDSLYVRIRPRIGVS